MITADELRQNIARCTSIENWYLHPFGLLYTDGVKMVAEQADADWLVDAIASCRWVGITQLYIERQAFQLWTLAVAEDRSALLSGYTNGPGTQPAITRQIPSTNFPDMGIILYEEDGILMLPFEHRNDGGHRCPDRYTPQLHRGQTQGMTMTPEELEKRLRAFEPTDERFRHHPHLEHTPGIEFLIQHFGAQWLMCEITTHQSSDTIINDERLQRFQCWKLINRRDPFLYCSYDRIDSAPIFAQGVNAMGFPLQELEMFVSDLTLMLPNEYDDP